ncbi:MAG: HD domain-containing protein [Actinomycetota bacterium]
MSLWRRPPTATDVAWVRTTLTGPEWQVWARLERADRVEAIATARRLVRELRNSSYAGDTRYLAAALCHDVGKVAAGIGPFRRVYATAAGAVRAPVRVRGRAGRYLRHATIGARMLREGGARPEAVAWAAAHHDPALWPPEIPREVCEALARADGESWSV